MLSESTCALLNGQYEIAISEQDIEPILFSLGGGYLNIQKATIKHGVLTTEAQGCEMLGGEDFTWRLVQHCVSEFERDTKIDISHDQGAL